MYLLAGSTGFLGNEILKILGKKDISTIALARRTIPNLPHNAKELIIDFNDIPKGLDEMNSRKSLGKIAVKIN